MSAPNGTTDYRVKMEHSEVDGNQNIMIFTEDDVKKMTSNYRTPIGKGGFGEVYKGILDDDYDLVAVKRYIREELREEFIEEVSIHSQMSHKNVVRLIGYCIGESNLTLVTEYIPKGNLEEILHNSDTPIPLDIRLGIAIGCAEGLNYMHSMHSLSDSLVCHGDIKPANILLDENMKAKISDFGVARLLSGGITRFTLNVKGSIDYMDPIYFYEGRLTPRSDVHSFGIVLLELISRKRVKEGDTNLIGIFSKACATGEGLKELFDSEIANESHMNILHEIAKLAIECLRLDICKRPRMNDVAKRLCMLKRNLKSGNPQSILATHHAWHRNYKEDTSLTNSNNSTLQHKRSLSFFKRNASNSKILAELGNIRIFTNQELHEVSHNYSCPLGGSTSANKVYKGTLEDNTLVVLRKVLDEDSKEAFIGGAIILSQIIHKNIIRLLGCCSEAESLAFVYEYATKRSLLDILVSQEDFPLDLRMRIAIKTAEALEYLHSPATGVIGHGGVATSAILLDDYFLPKLTGFSGARKLIKESELTDGDSVISRSFLEKVLYTDPSHYSSVLMNMESDVYMFGSVLLALISRENDHNDLVAKFTRAYKTDNSGKAIFVNHLTAQEDIAVLEEVGRLALKCTISDLDDIHKRPTMKEVAEQLRLIRRRWKERTATAATQVTRAEATVVVSVEPRLPNLMRHLFGYRRIII